MQILETPKTQVKTTESGALNRAGYNSPTASRTSLGNFSPS
ncbi:MAG TPA: hypothetical protein VM943_01980 [Pyrinomonadaceae bacterium]|nr:hypothetical protein [Pyrinomonadaceae bacterium]